MNGRVVAAPSPPAEKTDAKPTGAPDRRFARGLVLLGLGAVGLLAAAGLVIQPLLPEPYPLLTSQPLPKTLGSARSVMTNSDRPNDNEPLQWVRGDGGHQASLYAYTPGRPLSETERLATVAIPEDVARSDFDVNVWPPWRAEALFSFEQLERNLSVTVTPTWSADGKPETFLAPLSTPPAGTTREFTVGNWGGEKPDLFVITRGDQSSRPVLQILSGESGFYRQAYAARLPWRGLSPKTWSVQVAPIIGLPKKDPERIFAGDRVDLVLIHHDPAEEHSMVHVLLGETGFEWDAIRRDLDNSGSIPKGTEFLIGSRQGATAIYEVQRRGANGPHLKVYGLTNPPALQ